MNHREANMALDSGVDKSAMMSGGSAASETAVDYHVSYREAAPASAPQGINFNSVPGVDSSDPRVLAGFPNIDSWILPKAYAQDNLSGDKYLIRNGDISLKLDNIDDGQSAATAIAAKYGGTITNTNIRKDNAGYRAGTITLRIPSDKFMQVWSELMQIKGAEIITQSISTQDVGGEYVSQVSRMKALAAEQQTLQKMLDEALAVQRSRGLGEAYKVLLDTQSRLSEVTAQIQGVEDRIKAMADQITRSTITLEMTENPKIPAVAPDTFNWGMGNTFNAAVRDLMVGVRGFLNGAIYFIVTLQWIWWLLIFFAARWAWSFYRKWAGREQKRIPAEPVASKE
jgi:hypothetical protein